MPFATRSSSSLQRHHSIGQNTTVGTGGCAPWSQRKAETLKATIWAKPLRAYSLLLDGVAVATALGGVDKLVCQAWCRFTGTRLIVLLKVIRVSTENQQMKAV